MRERILAVVMREARQRNRLGRFSQLHRTEGEQRCCLPVGRHAGINDRIPQHMAPFSQCLLPEQQTRQRKTGVGLTRSTLKKGAIQLRGAIRPPQLQSAGRLGGQLCFVI